MLWWLIGGTRGGENRLRIIRTLEENPMNANKIAEELDLDYKTVQHHLDLMKEHNVITTMGEGYGKNYFLTDQMEENIDKLDKIQDEAGVEI
ncbi:MAG: winged helix-turn-helix domain-containing protein [Candidatus Nanosalina sp.]